MILPFTSTVEPPRTATSLERPYVLVDSPYIQSCFNLSTTATSLQRPPLHNDRLSTMATSLQWPPLHNDRLSTMATSPQ